MTTTQTTCYLIENSGETRQVWGPFATFAAAEKTGGKRHAVVVGSGLANGETMTRGAVQAAIQSGRIRTADGSELS